MMAAPQSGTLWDDRKTFTNYVLYVYYDKSDYVMEIEMTNGEFESLQGYRFHKCIYEFATNKLTFKVGKGTKQQN